MKEPAWVKKFKSKWDIKSNKDFFLIMLAFSLAGLTIRFVRPIEFHVLHMTDAPIWQKILIYPVLLAPTYYVGLMFFGFLLGQFDFSKRFAWNSLTRLGRLFSRLRARNAQST
ncbi:MAG: prolipoprotein diacylglyceryl transferase [Candidatus Omnitrophica bacterium]|nr:prolipoprotein diacylglyceryl transferase [Candidatus Omnitrophota bacterium]